MRLLVVLTAALNGWTIVWQNGDILLVLVLVVVVVVVVVVVLEMVDAKVDGQDMDVLMCVYVGMVWETYRGK